MAIVARHNDAAPGHLVDGRAEVIASRSFSAGVRSDHEITLSAYQKGIVNTIVQLSLFPFHGEMKRNLRGAIASLSLST